MTFNKSVHSLKTGTGLEEMLKSGTGLDKLEKPLPTNELGNHIVVTYQRLRLGMGFIALFFPLIILAIGFFYSIGFETSYSAYYFGLPAGDLEAKIFPGIFPTRVFFCGLLFALGVFLMLYKGFNWWEDFLLVTAGVAAICVAIFPMWYKDLYPVKDFPYETLFWYFSKIHYISAFVLFGCMALVAWFCSKTTLKDERFSAALDEQKMTWADYHPIFCSFLIAWLPVFAFPFLYRAKKLPTQRATFVRAYNWIGFAMALFPITALVLTSLTQRSAYFVLVVEAIGIWTFAAFWLLKSRELMLSQPEARAIKGMNSLPGGPSAAYVVGLHKITDHSKFEEYKNKIGPMVASYGGRYLTRGENLKAPEGGYWKPERVVVIEFPNMAAIEAWYTSPEYQPLIELRKACQSANDITFFMDGT